MNTVKRVLIADADPVFQSYLATSLDTRQDIEVAGTASDGYDTVEKITSLNPDVLLLDIILPKLDGLGVLRALGAMDQKDRPLVVVLSSFMTDLLEMHAASLGAHYFMAKPIDVGNLIDLIDYDEGSAKQAPSRLNNLKVEITELLHNMGIPSHVKGFYYLREAIQIAVNTPGVSGKITTSLYPSIAKTFSTTPTRVERAIRHAIEIAWDRGDVDTNYELFRNTVSKDRGKPTNSEFIATLADALLLQMHTPAASQTATVRH